MLQRWWFCCLVSMALTQVGGSPLPSPQSSSFEDSGEAKVSNTPADTELSAEDSLGIRPYATVPRWLWRRAWRWHGRILPWLHKEGNDDDSSTPDQSHSLKVLWNKALASVDPKSPVYEGTQQPWTLLMLPPSSRWIIQPPLTSLYPRLHHANIETRTHYLNLQIDAALQMVQQMPIENQGSSPLSVAVRLVVLGGGYDARSVRLLSERRIQQAWELDLPDVVAAKQRMLALVQKQVQNDSHPSAEDNDDSSLSDVATRKPVYLPTLRAVDLNDIPKLQTLLSETLADHRVHNLNPNDDPATTTDATVWMTIYLLEGVLIYLKEGIPHQLLTALATATRDELKNRGTLSSVCPPAALVFADGLPQVPRLDEVASRSQLRVTARHQLAKLGGWELHNFCPKRGATRHMGLATLALLGESSTAPPTQDGEE